MLTTQAAKYDFFILQSTTAAGQALNEFLRAHPRLFLPPREVVDQRFIDGQELRLVKQGPEDGDLPPWPNDYLCGCMLHDIVQTEESIPARVAALMVSGALFLQLVRDPIDACWAQYKRLAEQTALHELAHRLGKPGYETALPMRRIEEVVFWHGRPRQGMFSRAHFHHQVQRFLATHAYRGWEVIDAKELAPDRVDGTMEWIAGLLGVPAHPTPLYRKNFHGTLQKLLGFPFGHFVMNAYGHELPVVLELSPNVPFVPHGFRLELCRGGAIAQVALQPPVEAELSLCTSFDAWFRLPEKLREHLAGGPLAEFMVGAVLPEWQRYVDSVRQRCEELLVEREMPPSLIREMHAHLDRDLDKLVRHAPKLERLWTSWFSEVR